MTLSQGQGVCLLGEPGSGRRASARDLAALCGQFVVECDVARDCSPRDVFLSLGGVAQSGLWLLTVGVELACACFASLPSPAFSC
jgi:hypothetical protein